MVLAGVMATKQQNEHTNGMRHFLRYFEAGMAQGMLVAPFLAQSPTSTAIRLCDCFNQNAGVDDLSPRLMEEFLREVGSDLAGEARVLSCEALGRQMNVVGGPAESALPKNVGLLFFNEHPGKYFPATQIDVVWFPEGPGGDRFDEKTFAGPLARIVRDALGHIQANYLKQTVVKHADRAEAERFWNFPYAAIEEAVVNAVYHRSYEIREPIEVRITPDDLVVLSFPGLDRSIRMADLRVGRAVSRRYRNRRIGEFLKELDLAEGRSTGISKILRVMRANGSPAPVFDSDDDRSYFLIRLPAHAKTVLEKAPVKVSEKTSEKILAEIHKNNFVTIDELSQRVGVTTRSVERNLKILHDTGLLERIGPARGGHWAVNEIGLPGAGSEPASEITSVETSGKTSGKIVRLMRVNPRVTIPELADALGLTTRAIEMQVARLKTDGRVERVGPTKGGHWVVKEDA